MNRETVLEKISMCEACEYAFEEINTEEAMEILRQGVPINVEPCFCDFHNKMCTDILLCYEITGNNKSQYLLLWVYSDNETIRFWKYIL